MLDQTSFSRVMKKQTQFFKIWIIGLLFFLISNFSFAWNSKLFPYNPETKQYEFKIIPGGDNWEAQPNIHLLDFSYAGYAASEAPIPSIGVKATVKPGENIQEKVDAVSAMPKDSKGFRGAILLAAGTHTITKPIQVKADGIVIRGEGPDKTFIYVDSEGFTEQAAIDFEGTGPSWSQIPGNFSLLSQDINEGDTVAHVAKGASDFKVGDEVVLSHKYGKAFTDDHFMDPKKEWMNGQSILTYYRKIKSIKGDEITFTEPMTYRLKTTWEARITKINQSRNFGVEHLAIGFKQGTGPGNVISTAKGNGAGPTHGAKMVYLNKVTNAWVRDVKSYRPEGSKNMIQCDGIGVRETKWVTIEDCDVRDPYNITYNNGYLYVIGRSDGVLIKNCFAAGGLDCLLINGASSRVVLHHLTTEEENRGSDSHRFLASGILFDSCSLASKNMASYNNTAALFRFENRGPMSDGAGWTGTNLVMWNTKTSKIGENAASYIIKLANYGRNYIIGPYGEASKPLLNGEIQKTLQYSKSYTEGIGEEGLEPASLFDEQLKMRLAKGPEASAGALINPN